MTELDDELASAYLDGAATDEERARVEGDDALRARVDELRAARDQLAAAPVEPPDTEARDRAIRAAVDAAVVVGLDAERPRRRVRLASIAAAVLLVLGAAGYLLRAASDTSSKKASTATTAATAATSSTSASVTNERAAADATTFTAGAPLGTFADRPTLVRAVEAALSSSESVATTTAPAAPTAAGGSAGCAPPAPADATERLFTSSATLDGALVRVDVYAVDGGSRRLVVVDAATCAEVFTQAL